MVDFAWIQLGSPMVENSALPLDRKTYWDDSTQRNELTITQRRVWMVWFKVDDQKYYKLITNQLAGVDLLDSDWIETEIATVVQLVDTVTATKYNLQIENWNLGITAV